MTLDKRVEGIVNKFYQEFGVSAEIIDPKAENKFTGKYIRRWNKKPDIKTVARWWHSEITTFTQHHQDLMSEVVEKQSKRNATIKEYEDEGVMFVLKVENGKTYEASMPIPKWAEVGKLKLRK